MARMRDKAKNITKLPAFLQEARAAAADDALPEIKKALEANYSASGIQKNSGDLYRASVTGVWLEVRRDKVVVRMARGFDKSVYIRAQLFKKQTRRFFTINQSFGQIKAIYRRRLKQILVQKAAGR